MANLLLPSQNSEYPPELFQALVRAEERDVDNVGTVLTRAGLKNGTLIRAWFLVDFAAALRLLQWEEAGIQVHVHAGLTSGKQALSDFLTVVTGTAAPDVAERVHGLFDRVKALFVEQFAWSGGPELDAEVTLEPADEDGLLQGLADFLMACLPKEPTI